MYSPKYILGVNFGSYPKFRFSFKLRETVMIYGEMKDDEGSNSNGSGKSTLLKAVAYLLIDTPDGKLSKDDFIRDFTNSSLLVGEFYNPISNITLKIRRKIYRKKSNVIQIYKNGILNKQITSVAEGNSRILQLLDISKEDLLNYFIIDGDNGISFFSASDGDKKKVIARFSKVSMIDEAIERTKFKLVEITSKKDNKLREIEKYNTKIETLEESITYERESRKQDNEEEIRQIDDKLTKLSEKKENILKELKIAEKALKEVQQTDVKESSNEKTIEENENKITEYKEKIKKLLKTTREASKIITEVETIIDGGVTCPKCNHNWSLVESEMNLEQAKEVKKDTENIVESIEKKIEVFDKKLEQLEKNNEKLGEEDEELEQTKRTIENSKKSVNRIKETIGENDSEKERLEKKKAKIEEESKDNKRVKELELEIENVENEREKSRNDLKSIDLEWDNYNYWKINFVNFKSFLINKVLKTLEGYINFNLNKFKTFLSVNIDGYKTNKDGTLRENITVLVSKDGGDNWNKFGRHSGGQRGRINICGILTLQNLINSSSKSGGLDLLLLDEVFDGLDVKGQGEVIHTLEIAEITTMIISHSNNDVAAGNQLWVEHKNSISRILTNKEINKKLNKNISEIK